MNLDDFAEEERDWVPEELEPGYVVVERAGTDRERVIFKAETAAQCHDYLCYHDQDERETLGLDVMRRQPDGTLTTEL